ncbi:MAG: hypothetical protein EA376_10640 [Phycisphaeraceae bacterium]|nr:MAG: hypothetical protein EA376_10640 [Phycisphaeraceae bacterium]
MFRLIESTRAYILLFSIPFTLLWSRGLEPLGVVTGPLLVVLHACVAVFWMICMARADQARGLAPRLGLRRDRLAVDHDGLGLWFLILGAFVVVLTVVMLFAEFWIGVGALLATLLSLWLSRQGGRYRMGLIEAIIPAVLLVGPAMLFRAHNWPTPRALRIFSRDPTDVPAELARTLAAEPVTPEFVTAPVLAATWLGGAALLTVILLMLVRDRIADLDAGIETTATKLGRGGASALVWAWLLGVAALAAMGAGWGWWHWSVAMLAAWTAAAGLSLHTARIDGYAVGATLSGYGAMAVALGITTI